MDVGGLVGGDRGGVVELMTMRRKTRKMDVGGMTKRRRKRVGLLARVVRVARRTTRESCR